MNSSSSAVKLIALFHPFSVVSSISLSPNCHPSECFFLSSFFFFFVPARVHFPPLSLISHLYPFLIEICFLSFSFSRSVSNLDLA